MKTTPVLFVLLLATAFADLHAQTSAPRSTVAVEERAGETPDLVLFEKKAALSKELGATHLLVTDGLPLATWEMDATDPYPMWFVHHAGLLTIFPPKELEPYVDSHYSAEVSAILQSAAQSSPNMD